jgi:hypothetical protein
MGTGQPAEPTAVRILLGERLRQLPDPGAEPLADVNTFGGIGRKK